MKRIGALALVVTLSAFGLLAPNVDAGNASVPAAASSHLDHRDRGGSTVEDDPYTVLKPWIGTFSNVVKTNQRFLVALEGFEPRERVRVTIDSKNYNTRVWRSGSGLIMIRAPRKAGTYEIVAVGRTSGAEASTEIRVRNRR